MDNKKTSIAAIRRQLLILELAASALNNQINGEPLPSAKEAQKKLLLSAAIEAEHMREEIEQLDRHMR